MITEKLNTLRELMAERRIDAYVVPTSDFHDSEYVGTYFRAREYMSGFTGSAGTLIVTPERAALWTDGRYFLQAADQLNGSSIELMKMGEEGVPTISAFLAGQVHSNRILAFDGRVLSVTDGLRFEEIARNNGAAVSFEEDLVDIIWKNRPSLSANPVMIHDIRYAGRSASDKLADVRAKMKEYGCNTHILTSLDDIAWLLNLRGSDVECNPVFLSYLILFEDKGILFARTEAFNDEIRTYLSGLGIELREYNDIYGYVTSMSRNSSILIDANKLNYKLYKLLNDSFDIEEHPNPTTLMKSLKNSVEIDNLRSANINDGVAMVKFLYWLDRSIGHETITEISAAEKLESYRAEQPGFMGISFDTISGYNAHGAIIHYEPTPETDVEVRPEGLLLVDSGAQYLSGTTDITRTIAVGPLTDDMRHHYTMVLRANLNLAAARFIEGCSGSNLDILARAPFWDEGLDYNHGTGHGVGFFLNVHEGPQSFHWNTARKNTVTPLREGMVITDEPGIYIEGKYGIRIENDLLCLKDFKNSYAQFMKFEALTLCPIDLRPVNFNEMSDKEIALLNAYHSTVVSKLSPYLNADELSWLEDAVRIP